MKVLETIESTGAMIVVDDTNTGSRSFAPEVSPTEEPLIALAKGYTQVPCPFVTSFQDRLKYIGEMITRYRVDGVIFSIQKYCESEKLDFPLLREKLKQNFNVPVTLIETEFLGDMALIRTQVETFVESLLIH